MTVSPVGTLYDDAVGLLQRLCGPHGIRASESDTANYGAVFTRDAVMAGVAGLLIEDAVIVEGLVHTLVRLRGFVGAEGQIASNYAIKTGSASHVSFGSLVPRIDAPLWYLIGIGLAARAGALDAEPFGASVRAVVRLFDALEYNGRHLVYVPVGGDWADEYVYEGYVLHDQSLRAWALRLMSETFAEPDWREKSDRIEHAITTSFWPAGDAPRRYPLAAYSPARVYDVFDLATCSLLAVSDIAPTLGIPALDWLAERFLARGELPPAFHPVIDAGHPDWPALQRYHLHGFRNRPHEYHNGGVWPIWLGWLALALARTGRLDDLHRLRQSMDARLCDAGPWHFEEFFHGVTGRPGGTAQMAYSATGIIMMYCAGREDRLRLLAP